MTHFITFVSSFLGIATYASLVFRYWLKKCNGDKAGLLSNKEEAAFMTLATFVGTAIAMLLIYFLWMVTK